MPRNSALVLGDRFDAADEESLARLCERLRPRLEAFARQRNLASAAEDVVQETLLAAVTALRRGDLTRVESLDGWIFGILKHKMSDHRRMEQREPACMLPLDEFEGSNLLVSVQRNTILQGARQDVILMIREVLERMPARHWLVLMLNQRQGLTTREIARLIGLSSGRTGAVLAEAKELFRHAIQGEESLRRKRRLDKE